MSNIRIEVNEKAINKRIEEINDSLIKFHEKEAKDKPELTENPHFYIGVVNSMLIRKIAELELKLEKHYHIDGKSLLRR